MLSSFIDTQHLKHHMGSTKLSPEVGIPNLIVWHNVLRVYGMRTTS